MKNFDVMEVTKQSYTMPFFNAMTVLKLAWLPFAVVCVVALLRALLYSVTGSMGVALILNLIFGLITIAVLVPYMTAWLRIVVNIAEGRAPPTQLAIGKAEITFLLWALAAAGVALVIQLIIGGIALASRGGGMGVSLLLTLVLWIPLLYLFGRVSFLYPATAVEQASDPAVAWNQTKECHLNLFAVLLLILVPSAIVAFIIMFIFAIALGWSGVVGAILLGWIGAAIQMLILTLIGTGIGLAFVRVTGGGQ
jgi:hypothetical protein